MPRTIAQRDLRNGNAAIIDAVVAGESFVVTRHGTPVAELRPIRPERRTFVPRAALIEAVAHAPHIDYAAFRADLDRVLDQTL